MSHRSTAPFRHTPRLAPPPVAAKVHEETIHAGDIFVSPEQCRITTVLGSCIAVCLFDGLRCFGGMNHFLMPTPGEGGKYGGWSIRELYRRMIDLGSRPRNLQAKVFGGGSPLALDHEACSVGVDNAAVAFATLKELSVAITGKSVGSNSGMRIYFENWSGLVLVRPHRERSAP